MKALRTNLTKIQLWLPIAFMLIVPPGLVAAQPTITILTDNGNYSAGDMIEVSLGAENREDDILVDAYVGLLSPQGGIYTLGPEGFDATIEPWVAAVNIPSQFSVQPFPIIWLNLPSEMPPIAQDGLYCLAAGLARPGTLEFVSEVGLSSFMFGVAVESHYYVDSGLGDDANDGSPAAPWKTVTHALESVDGSEELPVTIHVQAGWFAPTTNGERFPLRMKSWISLAGKGAECTALDPAGQGRAITCEGVSAVSIRNFKMMSGDHPRGGAIFAMDSEVTIEDNIIEANHAQEGGGIYAIQSVLTVRNNRIWDNSAYSGGAIFFRETGGTIENNEIYGNGITAGLPRVYGAGIYLEASSPDILGNSIYSNEGGGGFGGGICLLFGSSPRILGNEIHNNGVNPYGDGGGIYVDGGSPEIAGNSIAGNGASLGGGIYCINSSPRIVGNTLLDHTFISNGGGICCRDSTALIADNKISGNTTFGGGGIYCKGGSSAIVNNRIIDNSSATGGGGICLIEAEALISNNTIAGNLDDTGTGGGIYCKSCSSTIVDCIIWGNEGSLEGCKATYCCLMDEDKGEGNIHNDPMFVTGPLGEFYLSPECPCLNAGSRPADEAELSGCTTQADGMADSGVVDMGFHYEIPDDQRPMAEIVLMEPNPAIAESDTIRFEGRGMETDGAIEMFEWRSDLAQLLSAEPEFSLEASAFPPGPHIISFRVRDVRGVWSNPAMDILTIQSETPLPVARILSILPNPASQDLDTVEFEGHGISPSSQITGFEWSSDLDGLLSAHRDFALPATSLTVGLHTISLTVRDVSGRLSEPAEEALQVLALPQSTVYVDPELGSDTGDGSVESPLKTIAFALATVNGSSDHAVTLHLALGTYSASTNGESFPLVMKDWVSLQGSAPADTVLDAEGNSAVIWCEGVSNLSINSLTVCGGKAYLGGGIYCDNASPEITDNIISGNEALTEGGGIYCQKASPLITRNTISGNRASFGGGVCCDSGDALIETNTITNNDAEGGDLIGCGGGIYCRETSTRIKSNKISSNYADEDGGGISCCDRDGSLILSNEITNNYSQFEYGGGIHCLESSPIIACNTIAGNKATYFEGGQIHCLRWGSPTIINNLVIGEAAQWDEGIYCVNSPAYIANCTVIGAGVRSSNYVGACTVENCIAWEGIDRFCTATFCCTRHELPGTGNISAEPMFVPGPLGDYYLHPDSPCIDAGSQSADEAGLADRTTRGDGVPDTGTVDMGFHYPVP